jgi:alpha-glucuronidase
MRRISICLLLLSAWVVFVAPSLRAQALRAEDGYDLWLRYHPVETENADAYRAAVASLVSDEHGAVIDNALAELERGLTGLLGAAPQRSGRASSDGALIVGTAASPLLGALGLDLSGLGEDGYVIRSVDADGRRATVIAGGGGTGALYGAFHYLRLIQTRQDVADLDITERPAFGVRMLNHWDNLDRHVERGYAGESIWDWHKLPDYLSPRYTDYARANASIGINATVLNNVNASAQQLTPMYIEKAAALANGLDYDLTIKGVGTFSVTVAVIGSLPAQSQASVCTPPSTSRAEKATLRQPSS